MSYRILFYDYVPDVLERRGPFREEHLARIRTWREDGRIVMAGAVGDPPHGAAIVFAEGVDPEEIEGFASEDPYVTGGIVAGRRVEPWSVV